MEPLLVGVTFVSLALASFMTLIAWNLLREKRGRTTAQAEALASLAFAGLPDSDQASHEHEDEHEPGPGNGAVEAAAGWDHALHARSTSEPEDLRLVAAASPSLAVSIVGDDLFHATGAPVSHAGRWLAVAAVALILAAGGVTAYALRTPEVMAAVQASRTSPGPGQASVGVAPLEILRLSHMVDADGEFVLSGTVQNPANGPAREGVAAVVNLLDDKGQLFATGRAVLSDGVLGTGQETRFEIRIPRAAGVTRYRIGFRHTPDNVVVEHVDRRDHLATPTSVDGASTTPDVQDAPVGLGRRSEG